MKTSERKYNYWRGFIAATLLMACIIALAIIAVAFMIPAPDYTMSPAQYQSYLNACAKAQVTQNASQATASTTSQTATTAKSDSKVSQSDSPQPQKAKVTATHPHHGPVEPVTPNTTCYDINHPVPPGVWNPCMIHADGTKTGGYGSYH